MSQDSVQHNKLKLLGKLTAGLLHEIRNPLSAIKLNLDLIKYYENDMPSEANESVEDCMKATERIEDLIENLLQYARKSNNDLEMISLNDVTINAVHLLNVKASKKSISLISELDNSIPKLLLNENKLLQVVLNLITNAVDACSTKGTVRVRTFNSIKNNEDKIVLEVIDNGVGISDEDQKKIFEDFFTSKAEGTGLGLTVCKSLIEEMNAELNFESKFGIGTQFTITFNVN